MEQKVTLKDIIRCKQRHRPIPRTACYDFTMARICETAGIEIINVGDTVGKYVYGMPGTNAVTVDQIISHAKAVKRGAPNAFIMGDMPFLSYRNPDVAVINAGRMIVEAEVDAVKVEGGMEVVPIIEALIAAGIPVIGHTGISLQSRPIGIGSTDDEKREAFLEISKAMEDAGAVAIVYTEVPLETARRNYEQLSVPVLATGVGPYTDSPMINIYELLGFTESRRRFAKAYGDLLHDGIAAASVYVEEVLAGIYPGSESEFEE